MDINFRAFLAGIEYGKVLKKGKKKSLHMHSVLRRWREEGAPSPTYPDQRDQSWASIYTCLPLGPPVKWVWWSVYTKETDSGEEHKQEEGEMSKPFAFSHHSSQPNILYYNKVYSIHILNKKHADFFFFNSTVLFSIKKKKG